ncbi:unnamed protein product [Durusdinium trenchii]|uniref:Pentatricopeptide repeat-containing protein, chloroplastic n=1 Tax=Durusdinium trenchii TaxID=1381693 RepID=A0ABP0QE00_9DINO
MHCTVLSSEVSADIISFNTVLSASSWRDALQSFQTLQTTASLRCDATSINSLLSACEKGSAWAEALSLLAWRHADVFAQSATISACSKVKLWEEALRCAPCPKKANVVTCSASIKACEEGGLWLEALHSLGELAGYRCVGNVFTYSAAISACEKSSAWPAASGLFQQMASCRVRPNVVSYGAAVKAAKDWQLSILILAEMVEAALRINTVVFSAVIAACARASQRNLVLAMSSEMVTAGVAMDAETCSAIVSVQLLPSTFTLQLLQRSCEDALIHFRS